MTTSMWQRLFSEDDGQDLIEYALLCSFMAFAAVASVGLISAAMNTTYTSWDTTHQSDALVVMPDPK